MEAGMKLFKQEEKRNTDLTGDTKVCVPIMGKNKRELLLQARDVVKMKPDIVEWRVDYLDISNKAEGDYYIHLIAKKIRNIFKNTEKSAEENKRHPLSAFRLSRAARTHGLLNLKDKE